MFIMITNLFASKSDCVTRGHPYKLSKRHCTSNVRSSLFSERVINVWNNLPSDNTVDSIKTTNITESMCW